MFHCRRNRIYICGDAISGCINDVTVFEGTSFFFGRGIRFVIRSEV